MGPEHHASGMVETSDSGAAMANMPSHSFSREALTGVQGLLPGQGFPQKPGCNHLPESRSRGLEGVRHLPCRTGQTAHERGIQNYGRLRMDLVPALISAVRF